MTGQLMATDSPEWFFNPIMVPCKRSIKTKGECVVCYVYSSLYTVVYFPLPGNYQLILHPPIFQFLLSILFFVHFPFFPHSPFPSLLPTFSPPPGAVQDLTLTRSDPGVTSSLLPDSLSLVRQQGTTPPRGFLGGGGCSHRSTAEGTEGWYTPGEYSYTYLVPTWYLPNTYLVPA